jgi:hypothetical protein
MTGRDLVKFIMSNYMEDDLLVFENTTGKGNGAWHHVEKKHFDKGNSILIIKHPEIKRQRDK